MKSALVQAHADVNQFNLDKNLTHHALQGERVYFLSMTTTHQSHLDLDRARKIGRQYLIGTVNPNKHNLINLSLTILLIGAQGVLLILAHHSPWWLSLTLFPLLLGWVFFCLYILVVHEASHQMYLITDHSTVLRWIDFLAPRFLSALSFQSFDEAWLQGHALHHTNPGFHDDPQNCPSFCEQGRPLLKSILKVLFIPGQSLKKQSSCTQKGVDLRPGLLAWGLLGLMILFTLSLKPLLALIISVNMAMAFNLIKVSLEHAGRALEHQNIWFKSLSSDFPLRSIFMPMNISLHFEHHLISRIPWYHLGAYHRALRLELSPETQKIIYNQGHRQAWAQLKGGVHDV